MVQNKQEKQLDKPQGRVQDGWALSIFTSCNRWKLNQKNGMSKDLLKVQSSLAEEIEISFSEGELGNTAKNTALPPESNNLGTLHSLSHELGV